HDETQDAEAVVAAGATAPREIRGVHLEDARDEDAPRRVVDPQVPLVGEETLGGGAQRRVEAVRLVGRRAERGAAVRAAVDREVDAGLAERTAQDLVLDVVEADRAAAGQVPSALEELAVARLPDGADRV